jgi:putative endonuclease
MLDADCLAFIEVRYRKSGAFATAAESVDRHKQRKLALTAAFFLSRKDRYANCPVRFDVIAIDRVGTSKTLSWIRDAFRPDI